MRHATAIARETIDRRRKTQGRGDCVIEERYCMTAAAMQQQTGDGRRYVASRARQSLVVRPLTNACTVTNMQVKVWRTEHNCSR